MTMDELIIELDKMVHALKLRTKKEILGRNNAVQYLVHDFGVIICGIEMLDYQMINENIENKYEGWRVTYITTEDKVHEKKDEVIWDLMRSGYMRWIRVTYPREFSQLLGMGNFGNKIIDQRLKIWKDQPKYKFLIEDNKDARRFPAQMILANEPGFFDYMP